MAWLIALLVLVGCALPSPAEPPKKLLLVGQGPDGHPKSTHEYAAGINVLAKCLAKVPGLETIVVRGDEPWKEGPELLGRVDGVVLFVSEGARWIDHEPSRREAFAKLAQRGGGLVALHWALGTRDAKPIDGYLSLLGGCHGGPDRKYQVVEEQAVIADAKHPIATGIENFRVRDEFYYRLKFVPPAMSVRPVLLIPIEGKKEIVAWSWERPDGGRSFGFSGLHFHDNWQLTVYRRLVAQGVLWSLKLPIPEKGLPVDMAEEDLKLK
jgi:hypothetical protein